MSEMKLNQRQMSVLRVLTAEMQQAQAAVATADGKLTAFLEVIKAQFDIPPEVQGLRFEDDGAISFETPAPIAPPADLPPAHPIIEGVKAMLGASAAAGSGLKMVERPIDFVPASDSEPVAPSE